MAYYDIPRYSGIYYTANCFANQFTGFPALCQWLPQVSLSSVTKLHDTASRTTLSQTFVNPSSVSPVAGAKYTFPLHESCAIVSFRCHVGTRFIEGTIKEKEEAKAKYQESVNRSEPAGMLEQHTPDVFSTSLGNIRPGETVMVEIEYITELRHDAEIDGLRFTIPTSIAPRYGDPPSGLSVYGAAVKGVNISVEITMPSNINAVQSPSHPISIHLGGHTEDTSDEAFNSKYALAKLSQTSTELGKDFILLVKCAELSSPSAMLETHPTIPNSKALMVTLVPKFRLPEGPQPEIVFIADRSSSMSHRVAPLKSSLSVFLKSLPLNIRFNICSFGSRHSFLWNKSRPYSDESLKEAQLHIDSMEANFGGTEILPPIKSAILKRFNDLMLDIMVLTDGEVWNSNQLFEYVEKETAKGDVRIFSLGIGLDVSHTLIDGLARVGRGFSQVVSDEKEGMESKVTRMLRGALSAHVNNYRLEWEGKPSEDVSQNSTRNLSLVSPVNRISLFDPNADIESPMSFSRLTDFVVPNVLQAPHKLQPLFPFSRSTAYAILSGDVSPPSRVWLRGTTPSGDELELEINVQTVQKKGMTIHQLAAKKILQELEEGTGYIHSGKYGINKESHPRTFDRWVKREGVRVGLAYGLASKWTSFLAVIQADEDAKETPPTDTESLLELDDEETFEIIDADDELISDSTAFGGSGVTTDGGLVSNPSAGYSQSPQTTPSVPVNMAFIPPPPPGIDYPTKSSRYSKFSSHSGKGAPLPANDAKPQRRILVIPNPDSDDEDYTSSTPFEWPSTATEGYQTKFPPSYSFLSVNVTQAKCAEEKSPASSHLPKLSHEVSSVTGTPPAGAAISKSPVPHPSPPYSKPSYTTSSKYAALQAPSLVSPSSLGVKSKAFSGDGDRILRRDFSIPPPTKLFSRKRTTKDSGKSEATLSADSQYSLPSTFPRFPIREWQREDDQSGTSNIAIAYSPLSGPPAARLSSETGTQPLSTRTKALISLQTFEGSFLLEPALATLLGIPIADLEAKLHNFVPSDASPRQEDLRSLWATLLAIKLFERKLSGERSVWELVVEKARVWMQSLAMVGNVVEMLEKLAGEVLGT